MMTSLKPDSAKSNPKVSAQISSPRKEQSFQRVLNKTVARSKSRPKSRFAFASPSLNQAKIQAHFNLARKSGLEKLLDHKQHELENLKIGDAGVASQQSNVTSLQDHNESVGTRCQLVSELIAKLNLHLQSMSLHKSHMMNSLRLSLNDGKTKVQILIKTFKNKSVALCIKGLSLTQARFLKDKQQALSQSLMRKNLNLKSISFA